jgi:hypothetical protein
MRTDTKIFQTKGIALKFSMSGANYEKGEKKKKKKASNNNLTITSKHGSPLEKDDATGY